MLSHSHNLSLVTLRTLIYINMSYCMSSADSLGVKRMYECRNAARERDDES